MRKIFGISIFTVSLGLKMEHFFSPEGWGLYVVAAGGLLLAFSKEIGEWVQVGLESLPTGSRLVKFWFRVKHPLNSKKREEAEFRWGSELAGKHFRGKENH